jgi:hypothetical protein
MCVCMYECTYVCQILTGTIRVKDSTVMVAVYAQFINSGTNNEFTDTFHTLCAP